ncbi:MAG: hypothetical protein SFX18_02985 [Pirellulales bacterium]|nr:hypothetical protein [Pirellulales bacterium]
MLNESIVRVMLTHPRRFWGVIGVTVGILFLCGLPEVDKYNELRAQARDFRAELAQLGALDQRFARYQQQLDRRLTSLRELEKKALTPENVQEFRENMVELTRDSGCTLRRIRVQDPQLRDWLENDDPLQFHTPTEKETKTPYQLQTQQLSIQVTGPLANIRAMLDKLSRMDRYFDTAGFVLNRSSEDTGLVDLDLQLLLFDLVKPSTAAN